MGYFCYTQTPARAHTYAYAVTQAILRLQAQQTHALVHTNVAHSHLEAQV